MNKKCIHHGMVCYFYKRNASNTLFWTHYLSLVEIYWKLQNLVGPPPYSMNLSLSSLS